MWFAPLPGAFSHRPGRQHDELLAGAALKRTQSRSSASRSKARRGDKDVGRRAATPSLFMQTTLEGTVNELQDGGPEGLPIRTFGCAQLDVGAAGPLEIRARVRSPRSAPARRT